jgi:hypothetical protein
MKLLTRSSFFNPVVNDASLFEENVSRPGVLVSFINWNDAKNQFFAPFLVILNAIEECIRAPMRLTFFLFKAAYEFVLFNPDEASKNLLQGFLAICSLLHLIPFSVICDFSITLLSCLTRPLATLVNTLISSDKNLQTKSA